MDNNPLVYSTDQGRIKSNIKPIVNVKTDGIIRIQRQTAGRKGKGVCAISGFSLDHTSLILLAGELKKMCGSGGCVKGNVIEIQGDKRDAIKVWLEKKGYRVKIAGG